MLARNCARVALDKISASTQTARHPGQPNFTGAFVGVACQDMSGAARHADFDWFEYREGEFSTDPRTHN